MIEPDVAGGYKQRMKKQKLQAESSMQQSQLAYFMVAKSFSLEPLLSLEV